MDSEELVVAYTLNDPNEAELVCNLLRDHGIACELDGEHQAGFTGMFTIGVLVKAIDADRAQKIIQSHEPEDRPD